jgi:hypothetical protein
MKAHYTQARIVYSGLIPKSIQAGPDGAIVQTLDTPALGNIHRFELNPFKVDGVLVEPSNWQQPPHVALANWKFDTPERACAFTRQYGVLQARPATDNVVSWEVGQELQDILRQYEALESRPIRYNSVVSLQDLRMWQNVLRRVWAGENDLLWQEFKPKFQNGEVVIEIGDLWPYISFLAQTDRHEERLAICPNIENACPAPYFIRERSDQRFCSVECRNFFNVQRWRSNPKNTAREKRNRKRRERAQA